MKYHSVLLVSAAIASGNLVICGCSTVNTVEPAESVAQKQMLADKRITTDGRLYGRVRPVGINTAVVSSGFLKIQIELQNLTGRLQSFAYHIEWFDANGIIVNTPTSAWIDRQIEGGETLSLTGVAPTENAKDFRIKLISK